MFYYIDRKQKMVKKLTLTMILLFLAHTLILSQDLVKAAQKEKERRARLTKKSSVVVTNDDLYDTNRQRALRESPPQKKAQNGRGTTTQRAPATGLSQPTSPQKRVPNQQADNRNQINIRVDSAEQRDQMDARGFRSEYASQVLGSNELVRNPESALDKPDGKFTEIPIQGFIDLEISAKNGPGDDIAVYAKHAGAQTVAPGGEEEGGIPEIVAAHSGEGLWYGVLGMNEQGDWVEIGKGSGTISPEKFDLGDMPSIKKLRILFKPFGNADFPVKYYRAQASESYFCIDAVETLHK
jgi:hypothetical protein